MRATDTVYENDQPVSEERARALAINEAVREPLSEFLDRQRSQLVAALGAGAVTTLLGLALVAGGMTVGAVGVLAGIVLTGGGYYYVRSRSPEVQVQNIKKGYWTGYSLPGDDGVLLYDATAGVPDSEFQLERVTDEDRIEQVREELGNVGDFPVVMTEDRQVESEFTDLLETVETELATTDSFEVTAPVLTRESPETAAITSLIDHADSEPVPVETTVGIDRAKADLGNLSKLGNIAEENPVEAELETITDRGTAAADDLSTHQDDAVEILNDHIQTAADAFGLVSYNFYCPDCFEDDIESQLGVPDDDDEDLYCETCRSYHTREKATPRHEIKDDIVLPTWDQLWAEKADEKRRIYENIEDQKRELKEREYEQYREEVRTTTERIRDLRAKIRDLKTEAQAAQGTVREIGSLMVKFDRLKKQRMREFSTEVEQIYDEIDAETEQILEETQVEEQERLEEAEKRAEQKAELLRIEQRQRNAEMLAAQRQIHQETARAQAEHREELARAQAQHETELTAKELDQEERHHRENWLLETRGKMSFSETIDRMKQKKDRMLGASTRGD